MLKIELAAGVLEVLERSFVTDKGVLIIAPISSSTASEILPQTR